MRKLFIIGLFSVAFFSVGAQTEDWYQNKPVVDITFDGLENVKISDLEGIKYQVLGKVFDEALFLDLQSKLYATNYFESFEASALPGDTNNTTVILHFKVIERPLVDDVVFRGNDNLRRKALQDVITTNPDDILNKARIRADSEALKSLYVTEGFPDVVVEGTTENIEKSNKVRVIFRIDEGKQTKVKKIFFSGNSFASSGTLKRTLATKEQSFFNSGIYEEGKLQQDRKAIQDYYHERGYVDAAVVDIAKEVERDKDGKNLLTLTFYVDEGKQYTFGGISFEGNTLYSDEILQKNVRSEVGKVLNKIKLEADLIRVRDTYYNEGYIFTQVTPEEILDANGRVRSYIVHIREEGRAHIENITIKGNLITKDYVILREIPLSVGDVFSKDKILSGLRNLANLRYFTTFLPETPQGTAPGLMDLVINVEEGRTTDLNFGITFTMDKEYPLVGLVRWADHNFLGRGLELSVGLNLSQTRQSLDFGFKDNWLFGKRWSGGLNFSIEHRKVSSGLQDILAPTFTGTTENNPQMVPDPFDGHWVDKSTGEAVDNPTEEDINNGSVITDYAYSISKSEAIDSSYLMEYETFSFSLGGSTGYSLHTPLGRVGFGTGLTTGLSYTNYDANVYRPYVSTIRDEQGEWNFINRWWGRITFDTRDITYNPSKGFYLSQGLTYYGGILGGVRHYNKLTTIAEAFFTLFDIPIFEDWSFKSVLALHSNLSLILPQMQWSKGGDAFASTVATTTDLLYIDGMLTAKGWPITRDGEALWNNWMELRFPIIPNFISLNGFFSATALYEQREDMEQMDISDFLFSFGGGLQLDLPSFPIGFYLVKRFNIVDNEVGWQKGDVFVNSDDPTSGLDFVISFNFSYF